MWRKIADLIFSRYIFIIDLLILLILAAFVAGAVDQVVSGMIDGAILKAKGVGTKTAKGTSIMTSKVKAANAAASFQPADGTAILSRNFFDSETGPLDDSATSLGDVTGPEVYGETAEDLTALPPRCSAPFTIVGLFAANDPAWAFAAVQINDKTQIVRVGETLQSFKVNDITWKYLFLGQAGGATTCYLDIWGDEIAGVKASPAAMAAAGKFEPPPPTSFEDKKNFQSLLNSSIQDVSPTEKNIDKSLIDYLLENKQMMMQSGRVLPNIENEEINGFKVYGIRKTSLWGMLGVQNGDVIKSVNGTSFTGPDSALEAFGKLQGSDHLLVTINRRGSEMNLDFNIK
jgi:general secretion pathway protein C